MLPIRVDNFGQRGRRSDSVEDSFLCSFVFGKGARLQDAEIGYEQQYQDSGRAQVF